MFVPKTRLIYNNSVHNSIIYTCGGIEMTRVKVLIRCKVCGEKYILRGRKDNGVYDTGFKRCVCDNSDDLEVEEHPI